jgi:hypothetical protein
MKINPIEKYILTVTREELFVLNKALDHVKHIGPDPLSGGQGLTRDHMGGKIKAILNRKGSVK